MGCNKESGSHKEILIQHEDELDRQKFQREEYGNCSIHVNKYNSDTVLNNNSKRQTLCWLVMKEKYHILNKVEVTAEQLILVNSYFKERKFTFTVSPCSWTVFHLTAV